MDLKRSDFGCIFKEFFVQLLIVNTALFSTCAASSSVICSFEEHFCGWFPYAENSSWRRWDVSQPLTTTNGVRPPTGAPSMAYVISSTESWAELLSEPLNLTRTSMLTFDVLQTRFGFATNMPQVTLWTISPNGTYNILLWASDIIHRWNTTQIYLSPALNGQKLLFQFRVGFRGQTAALANIELQSVVNQTILNLIKARNETLVKEREMLERDMTSNSHRYATTNITRDGKGDGIVSCTFARSYCGWNNFASDGRTEVVPDQDENVVQFSQWERTRKGGQPFLAINISKNSTDEWFVEYRGNTTVPPSNISDIPKLSVTFNNPTKWRNISFWYLRRGDLQSSVVFTLAAIKVDRMGNVSIPEMIWNSKADKKNYWKWRLAKVSIPFDGNVMLEFACRANIYTICAVDNIILDEEEVQTVVRTPTSGPDGAVLYSQRYISHYSGSPRLNSLYSSLTLLCSIIFIPTYLFRARS